MLSRPVCWGRFLSSWAGQVILQLRIIAWRAGTGTSCSFIQLRLVHRAKPLGPGSRRETSSGLWDGGVRQSAGLPEHPSHGLFTLGRARCRAPGLTEKKLNQKPAWLVLWDAINSQGLAYAVGGHIPPPTTGGLDILERPSEGKLDKQAASTYEALWEHKVWCDYFKTDIKWYLHNTLISIIFSLSNTKYLTNNKLFIAISLFSINI